MRYLKTDSMGRKQIVDGDDMEQGDEEPGVTSQGMESARRLTPAQRQAAIAMMGRAQRQHAARERARRGGR